MTEPVNSPAPSPDKGESTKWLEKLGFGRLSKNGFHDAASNGINEMQNALKEGHRIKGFARIGSVGIGTYVAAGALRSKDAEGNDRSALARVGNLVIGSGMVAGGLLAGGRV